MATRQARGGQQRPAKGAAQKPAAKKRRRPQRSTILLRWCILGTVGLVAFLYYRPISSYLETRSTLNERAAEVQSLRQERARLQARLADSTTVRALSREARRMGLVRPGERLYIVKGVEEWRRAHVRKATTIAGNG